MNTVWNFIAFLIILLTIQHFYWGCLVRLFRAVKKNTVSMDKVDRTTRLKWCHDKHCSGDRTCASITHTHSNNRLKCASSPISSHHCHSSFNCYLFKFLPNSLAAKFFLSVFFSWCVLKFISLIRPEVQGKPCIKLSTIYELWVNYFLINTGKNMFQWLLGRQILVSHVFTLQSVLIRTRFSIPFL